MYIVHNVTRVIWMESIFFGQIKVNTDWKELRRIKRNNWKYLKFKISMIKLLKYI